nr:basigin-like [Loxodonta africana]
MEYSRKQPSCDVFRQKDFCLSGLWGGDAESTNLLFFSIGSPCTNAGAYPACCTAGFLWSPLSQERGPGDHVELHCEAVGNPVPEIQWWFQGPAPDTPCAQLWDGARQDRVHIHTTYRQHAASTLSIAGLTVDDVGTYECRASNDPDRNHLTRAPRIRWVHAQASVLFREREWRHTDPGPSQPPGPSLQVPLSPLACTPPPPPGLADHTQAPSPTLHIEHCSRPASPGSTSYLAPAPSRPRLHPFSPPPALHLLPPSLHPVEWRVLVSMILEGSWVSTL